LALKNLWINYFNYLENIIKNSETLNELTIFAHNLGDFDGYFLYKGLMKHYTLNIYHLLLMKQTPLYLLN